MKWDKLGLIYTPSGEDYWLQSYAALPLTLKLKDSIYRVYFASRDAQNRSHVGYADIDMQNPGNIIAVSSHPVLEPGPLGCFDDHGVYPASIVRRGREVFMYYIGWNPSATAPIFYSSIGLAISKDGGHTFNRASNAPVMARSEFDPCLVTSPFVLEDGGKLRMWYVSGFKWEREGDTLHSYYHIKYAESEDGIHWNRNGVVSIDLRPGELNVARPCVLKEDEIYKMWYCYNIGQGYRIGYAESKDGLQWQRMDAEAGIGLSPSGWDSEALAYPHVFVHNQTKYLLYNGNSNGKDGFGMAIENKKTMGT